MVDKQQLYRQIPSVHDMIQWPIFCDCTHIFSVQIAQNATKKIKHDIGTGACASIDQATMLDALEKEKQRLQAPKMRRVINGTGVVIHTNLGRAPIPLSIFDAMKETLSGYTNLEMSLQSGKRGGRIRGVTDRLCALVGAEDAVVVNNNAAAILLAIGACSAGGDVLVSRGELVEIGGSFRIPDIIETGGARLVEVGTTNRTRVSDYAAKITTHTSSLLRVHSSNFSIIGFTEQPKRSELAQLAHQHGIPLIEDLGSGLLGKAPNIMDARRLEEEESIQVALAQGADLVTFSGDKLLGGPQSGFIAGSKELVQKCRTHPLYRAMRLGKMSLLALEHILQVYVEGRQNELPVWKSLQQSPQECSVQAEKIVSALGQGEVVPMNSFSGGGALPNQAIESFGYFLRSENCQKIAEELRTGMPSVLVRIQNQGICIDPRTLLDGEMEPLLKALLRIAPLF